MRILFRKKLTPLVTNFQANVSNICESYDVKKKDNLENIEYCKIEYANSAEKDVISGRLSNLEQVSFYAISNRFTVQNELDLKFSLTNTDISAGSIKIDIMFGLRVL